MIIEVKVPSPGESITEVEIGSWLVEDGAVVAKDQEIAEIESDKATLTIVAADDGKISLKAEEGETVPVGQVVCTIDTSVKPAAETEKKTEEKANRKQHSNPKRRRKKKKRKRKRSSQNGNR